MATKTTDIFEDTPQNFINDDGNPDPLPKPEDVMTPEATEASEVEIEVIDDTPEEDRRPPRAKTAEIIDPESEELKKEIDEYGEGAQKRIKQLSYQFHEERRQREAAIRQNDEAIRFAENIAKENKALKDALDTHTATLSKELSEKNAALLEQAEEQFKTAYDNGDSEGLVAAQRRMSALYAETMARPVRSTQPHPQDREQDSVPVTSPAAPHIPPPDPKATKWLQDNRWFQTAGHEDMTGLALGLHEKLVKEGYDPTIHAEYYTEIDKTLHAAFPEYFGQGNGGGPPAVTARKAAPVAAPTRGGKVPRKVQLTTTQVALAKRLGVPIEEYAKQVAKEQTNG